MHSMIYTSDEWQHANHDDKQAVVDWVNTLDLPAGHVLNLLHTDGQVVVEYGWTDMFGTLWLDVHGCNSSQPPAAFFRCARDIAPTGGHLPPDVLTEMGGAWVELTWQMLLVSARRVRRAFRSWVVL